MAITIHQAAAGETYSFRLALVDGETGTTISAANVAEAWVKVGSLDLTLSDSEVSLQGDNLQVALAPAQTEAFTGVTKVHAKVRLSDGRTEELTGPIGEAVNFIHTPLTEEY